MSRGPLPIALSGLFFCLVYFGGAFGQKAAAVEYNFAGSVSLNYKTLVNELADPNTGKTPVQTERSLLLSGFNLNASVKAVVDVTRYLSASVKMCYGCHGLEAASFFVELTPHPAFNIRAGRIMPAFGDFYLRHDPTVHKTADNPLPYDMGHMIHTPEWGMSVLPIPYVDTGAEIFGTLRPNEWISIAYSAHVVNGWKGPQQTNNSPPNHDFSFRRMRFVTATDYLVDNNRWPAVGGRMALTFARSTDMPRLVPDITLGGSAMYGTYDDYDRLSYLIYGVDFYMRIWRINVRGELIRRQQEVDPRLLDFNGSAPHTNGLLNVKEDAPQTTKDGFYVESDFPLGSYLEGVVRFDGMRRSGPREARTNPDEAALPPEQRKYVPAAAAALDFDDWIMRYTFGLNVIPITGAKIKLSYEYWTFKDVQNDPYRTRYVPQFHDEHEIHIALVASF